MDKLRLITQTNENGSEEYVEFTDDFDAPVENFAIPGCEITSDTVIDDNLPTSFPRNYALKRKY